MRRGSTDLASTERELYQYTTEATSEDVASDYCELSSHANSE